MNEHEGHRQRMRQRFLRHGLDSFDDHNILELLLFFALPRADTNLLAHRLLDAFGSLDGVFDAEPEKLMAVKGVGENAAVLIRLVPEAARRYLMSKTDPGAVLKDSRAAGMFLMPRFFACHNETVYLVCMDAKLKVLDCRQLDRGTATSVNLGVRQIVQVALEMNASAVLLAHNHSGGLAVPSEEDVAATLRVRKVLADVGIVLTDHLVMSDDDFVSMADSGYLPPL